MLPRRTGWLGIEQESCHCICHSCCDQILPARWRCLPPCPPIPTHFWPFSLAVASAFPLVLLGLARLWSRLFQPAKPGVLKNAVYECGVEPTGDSWIQFKAHYYLYAIIFLIFDVEVLFLLPFAVAFTGLPAGALLTMLVFVLLLAEGLVWAWQRGHLEWTLSRMTATPEEQRDELRRHGILLTSLEELYNWGRSRSVWPLQFGLACCAIEMIAASMARFDIARFGSEVFRPSPRQADLLIVSGTVTKKMAPQVVRLWNQMPEPKYCIAMGACAISGGPFKQGYNVLKGIDRYIPVDIYIPGCPPRPEALLHGLIAAPGKDPRPAIRRARRPAPPAAGRRPANFRCRTSATHDLEPPQNPAVWQPPVLVRPEKA